MRFGNMPYKSPRTAFNLIVVLFFMVAGFLWSSRGRYPDLAVVNKVGHAVVSNQLACAYAQAALEAKDPNKRRQLNCKAQDQFKRSFRLNPQDRDVYHNFYLILETTAKEGGCLGVNL